MKFGKLLALFAVVALVAACGKDSKNSENNSAGPGGDPGTSGDQPGASIADVCSNYTCHVGCQGMNVFECKSDGKYYSNESGRYAEINLEVFWMEYNDKYGARCGDGELCSEPDSPVSSSSSGGGYSGGGGFCSQHGCGGILCAGDCIGCPGC